MRDLQESSKFGTEKTTHSRLLWGWHGFVSKSPGGFVDNPGQAFFLFTHALGTRLWTKKQFTDSQFMRSNPDCISPAPHTLP
jgi:hypothetical protein